MDRVGGEYPYRRRYSTVGGRVVKEEPGGKKITEKRVQSAAENRTKKQAEEVYSRSRKDVIELTGDWNRRAEEYLEELRRGYPGLDLITGEMAGSHSVREIAVSLGAGTHLIVTKDFLERMGSGSEEYLRCRDILSDTLSRLSKEGGRFPGNGVVLGKDKATYWSLSQPEKKDNAVKKWQNGGIQAGNETERSTGVPSESDYRMSVKLSNLSTASSYARLAGAATKSQVKSVMGEAHRSMASLRLVAALGEEKDRKKARAAIGSLQKLLLRGNKKIKKLDEETLLRIRRKRAEKHREREKVRELKRELEKKRSLRGSYDSIINAEGKLDELNRKFQFREDKEWESNSFAGTASDGALFSGTDVAAGAGSFTAADVAVSEVAF